MFYEIAITPSVFKTCSYTSPDVCDSELRGIWSDICGRLIIRNLRAGKWYKELKQDNTETSPMGRKILSALHKRNRLRGFCSSSINEPISPKEWCEEALASHAKENLTGVLSCIEGKQSQKTNNLVCSIMNRHLNGSWWSQQIVAGPPPVRRTTANYLNALGVILKQATHIMIMDPHLDPSHHDYREIDQLLIATHRSDGVQPKIEIHRVCYTGAGNRKIISNEDWENNFKTHLKPSLQAAGVEAEVFIWPDAHDRHIITNLGGIHLGNGLKTNNNPNDVTTWTRMPSTTADEVQRQFDPSENTLIHRFLIVGS